MKKVFSNHAEIANEFINGNFEGFGLLDCKRSRNASTDGRAFWSYSTCIACKYGEFIAVDSCRYSNTTAKQRNEIERFAFAANLDTFRVPDIHRLNSAANVEYYQGRIIDANAKLRRARSGRSRDAIQWQLRDLLHGWRALVSCCRVEGLGIANITL